MPINYRDVKRGEPARATHINQNAKGILQGQKAGPGMEKRNIGNRESVIRVTDQGTPPVRATVISKALIQTVYEEYLECSFYTESSNSTSGTVLVAKPIEFRPSFYDGETINYANGDSITYSKDATNPEWKREADDGSTAVDQIVLPTYTAGQVIRIYQTNTSVQVSGTNLAWEEMSNRVWAKI